MTGFTSFPRVTSSSDSNLLCRGLGTTVTTTPLDLVRLVDALLALVKLVGFLWRDLTFCGVYWSCLTGPHTLIAPNATDHFGKTNTLARQAEGVKIGKPDTIVGGASHAH